MVIAAITAAACISATGCGGDSLPAVSEASLDDLLGPAIVEAREGGASDEQVAILERAASVGRVTFDDANVAAIATLDCLAASGISGELGVYEDPNGLRLPTYTVAVGSQSSLAEQALVDSCVTLESYWVNKVYQLQPSSVDLTYQYLEKQAPMIRGCLAEAGRPVDSSATPLEVAQAATQLAVDSAGSTDCNAEAGVTGY